MTQRTSERFDSLLSVFRSVGRYGSLCIRSERDIARIPFTTKEDLQSFNIRDCPEPPTMIWNTSGSGGRVTLIGLSKQTYDRYLDRIRFVYETYTRPHIRKEYRVVTNVFDTIDSDFLRRLGMTVLSSGRAPLDEEEFSFFLKRYLAVRPNILLAPSSFVHQVLTELNAPDFFDSIIYGGILTTPAFNRSIQRLTSAAVYESYCATEYMLLTIRQPTSEDYFTVIAGEEVHLEVLDAGGRTHQEGIGSLVLTDFENHSYPIIRYVIGDIVELKTINGTRMVKVLGRRDNYIKLKGELICKDEITSGMMELLGHNIYLVKVFSEEETLTDRIEVHLQEQDLPKSRPIREHIIGRTGLRPSVHTLAETVPQTATGKKIAVLDMRQKVSSS